MATPQDLVNADLNLATLDGVVTSNADSVNNRLGRPNLTLKGFENRANAKIDALGFARLEGVTFETGATVPDNRSLLLWATADGGTGFYYYFSGEIPSGGKVVPPDSTPGSTGGTGAGGWLVIDDLEERLGAAGSDVFVSKLYARELNPAGDIRRFLNRATNNHTQAFIDAVNFCRAEDKALFIPNGIWDIEEPMPDGKFIDIVGESVRGSILALNFSSPAYMFTITGDQGGNNKLMSNFTVQGSAAYGSESFLTMANAYTTNFANIYALNMGTLLNLNNCWGSHVTNILAQFVKNPIGMNIPNGSTLKNIYIQRFRGTAIYMESGLATGLENITVEYGSNDLGEAGGIGMYLRAMQSWSLNEYYTEGGMDTELLLDFKNQKACMNGSINTYWSNSNPNVGKKIHAKSVRGLTIDNVTTIVPSIPLIDFSDRIYSDGLIDVGLVTQVNPNANDFAGDVRGEEPLRTISTDNSLIRMFKYAPNVGNGRSDDPTNIAPHTQPDVNGLYCRSNVPASASAGSLPSGLTATSSTVTNDFGALSSGIKLSSRSYQSCKIVITGVITSSTGAATFTDIRLVNATSSENRDSGVIDSGASGSTLSRDFTVNLVPGVNVIKLALTRAQGGGGSNTLTVSDFYIEQV